MARLAGGLARIATPSGAMPSYIPAMTAHRYPLGPAWPVLFAQLGVRTADVLRLAGLPTDLFALPDPRVTGAAYLRLAGAFADLAPRPDLAVRLAEHIRPETFDPPLFAALCSADLTTAVERLARFKPLLAPIRLHVVHGDGLDVGFVFEGPAPAVLAQFEVLFLARLARLGTHTHVVPARVTLREPPADPGPFEAFLGCRIQPGEDDRVVFHPADARRPFLTANPAMWEVFEPHLRQRLDALESGTTFAERAHTVLLEELPAGSADVERVARRLAVSRRTLQRRLRDEGTTFKDVVRGTREQLATHYLARTTLSSDAIAGLLGFGQTSSFYRAFHDWTGQTPEVARKTLRGEA